MDIYQMLMERETVTKNKYRVNVKEKTFWFAYFFFFVGHAPYCLYMFMFARLFLAPYVLHNFFFLFGCFKYGLGYEFLFPVYVRAACGCEHFFFHTFFCIYHMKITAKNYPPEKWWKLPSPNSRSYLTGRIFYFVCILCMCGWIVVCVCVPFFVFSLFK